MFAFLKVRALDGFLSWIPRSRGRARTSQAGTLQEIADFVADPSSTQVQNSWNLLLHGLTFWLQSSHMLKNGAFCLCSKRTIELVYFVDTVRSMSRKLAAPPSPCEAPRFHAPGGPTRQRPRSPSGCNMCFGAERGVPGPSRPLRRFRPG